jgi:putative ABC transport system permease protein
MLKNYFKIVWRNLLKDRQFTILNLVGLSTGLACSLLIFLWVSDELNIDKFHKNNNRLFQVMANHYENGGIRTIVQTPALLANAIAAELPEVEYAVAAYPTSYGGSTTLLYNNKNIKTDGLYAGPDYFNVFSYDLLEGNKSQVLRDKNFIVISKNLAHKLFNTTTNVIGKTINFQHERLLTVSGVFENPPFNSSVQFDFLVSMDVLLEYSPYLKEWGNSDPATYVVLKKGADTEQFNRKISDLLKEKSHDKGTNLFIRRYSDGYLHNIFENGIAGGGRIAYVKLFSVIAVFILIIACINFMNLSTARAARRMKEVGIKKVVGVHRNTLIWQYLGEAMLMTLFSMVLALQLVALLLPAFNEITGKHLTLHLTGMQYLYLLAITVFTGLVSGSYPAFYLSGFHPAVILKGKLSTSAGELFVRKGLVVFQFAISMIFFVGVLVVYRQIAFIQNKKTGYNKDNVVSIDMEGRVVDKIIQNTQTYLAEIRNMPGIVNASSMDHGSIIDDFGSTSGLDWEGRDATKPINFGNIGINYGLIETMGMQMAAGRSFSKQISADTAELILNEAAIKIMGLKNPVGKTITMWGQNRKIAGVIRNFHFQSVHEPIKPFVFRLEPLLTNHIIAKVKAGMEKETLQQMEQLYTKINPGFTFNYKFLDQDFKAQYVAEKRVAVLSKYFAGLAIIISCLGLFGLSAFTAQKREKEIGIRKVVGASSRQLMLLLSKDFLKLVIISILIAFPMAWWAVNEWLNGYAYRINPDAGLFILAGASVIVISVVTISFQSIKAALVNPVKILHNE